MRLVYTADLHGNVELYQALLELAVSSRAQAVVVGGDLLPHISRLAETIAGQRAFITDVLRSLLEQFRSAHPTIEVFLLPGNDDWAAAITALEDLAQAGLARPLHLRCEPLNAELSIAGYACVPPTPFSIKDYERPDHGSARGVSFGMAYTSKSGEVLPLGAAEFARRPCIAQELDELARLSDPRHTIYVCHTPPFDTPIDLMRGRRHVGSPALRTFIERATPPLTLHGHIHEAPELSGHYACRIGPTWCINPGRDARRLHAVTLDTDDIAGTLRHTIYGRQTIDHRP